MSTSDDNYTDVLMEKILDEVKAVHELVASQPTRVDFNMLQRDVDGLKRSASIMRVAISDLSEDVKVIKAVATDNSSDLDKHEHRITRLENKAA